MKYSEITIRPGGVDDQPGILDVETAAAVTLRQVYRLSLIARVYKARIDMHLRRLVAVADGRVVGTVQYYMNRDCLRVLGLGVHSDFRRQGVARSLFESLEEIGAREKARQLQLHTVKQTGNVEIFRRLGYVTVSEKEDNLLFESDRFGTLIDVEMAKDLN